MTISPYFIKLSWWISLLKMLITVKQEHNKQGEDYSLCNQKKHVWTMSFTDCIKYVIEEDSRITCDVDYATYRVRLWALEVKMLSLKKKSLLHL